ncbi:hypothetical protein [Streptococcus suis]|uniref:Membrane protein n=1 Tax=Streptococcus suis TaxID=1307 RepID=A0AB33UA98_STRSU|nr:hypothetical protein [Streptococcus suis]NQH54490.1 hypothetical protein [Streptococcus suis]NQN58428.1 hypothetical protein [Streptococcus suis]NQO92555.1 hypothetical protein [Streptococcus suis]CYU96120.1 membrane protein [Streptococcus suis]CYX52264.1 membrane protein [Streptococcus suis]
MKIMITFFKTFKWLNYYNIFWYSLTTILVLMFPCSVLDGLVGIGISIPIFTIGLTIMTPIFYFNAFLLLLSILVPFIASKGDIDFFKSLRATHKIRRYARFEQGKKSNTVIATTATEAEKNLANAAVKTLTVTYYQKIAIVSIKLPENYGAQQLLLEKLPGIKNKLNALNNGYQFSDLTPEDDRLYSAIGRRTF